MAYALTIAVDIPTDTKVVELSWRFPPHLTRQFTQENDGDGVGAWRATVLTIPRKDAEDYTEVARKAPFVVTNQSYSFSYARELVCTATITSCTEGNLSETIEPTVVIVVSQLDLDDEAEE